MAKWDNVEHGNAATYRSQYYACRCEACRLANSVRAAEERKARRKRGLPEGDPRHGTVTGYNGYGCRCDACSLAASHANRDHYLARKEREKNAGS